MLDRGVSVLQEFRDFIMRGNVVDLAVAVVIGAAFGAVVTALVTDIVTPLITAVVGEPSFAGLSFTIHESRFLYGDFLTKTLSFVTIAAVVFLFVVKPINALLARRKAHDEPPPAAPSEDIVLLTEIRDLLRAR